MGKSFIAKVKINPSEPLPKRMEKDRNRNDKPQYLDYRKSDQKYLFAVLSGLISEGRNIYNIKKYLI